MYMRVIKRSGRIEDMKFDNVTNRIKNLTSGLSENCDSTKVAQQVFSSMYDNITAQEIDTLSAEICVGVSVHQRPLLIENNFQYHKAFL